MSLRLFIWVKKYLSASIIYISWLYPIFNGIYNVRCVLVTTTGVYIIIEATT